MKRLILIIIPISLAILVSCKNNEKEAESSPESTTEEKVVEVEVEDIALGIRLRPIGENEAYGKVSITETDGEVTFEANLTGLTPGMHAIHLHEKADCSSEDGSSAGGHWNPTFEAHGAWGAETGFHRGDIGNFEVDEKGNGSITLTTDLWCIGCEDETKNILGKAIIVHQGEDDLTSQPSGAAGARVSCGGVIE